MNILIVDDHRLFRDGIKLVLNQLDEDVAISEAGDGAQALALIEQSEFDLGLLDYHLPDTNGPQLLKQIKETHPELPVVIMSGAEDPAMIRSALASEASGFIPKSLEPEELVDALKLVLKGELFVPPSLLEAAEKETLDLKNAAGFDYGDLIHLAQVTQKVIETSDWSLRARSCHAQSPETINAFNKMLERMEAQYSELKQYAFQDALTGLPNRRVFDDRLDQELLRLDRSKGLIALVVLDLDGFKQINDTMGHAAGDQLLVCIADRLKEATRKVDTVCRLGGDEFISLITDVQNEDAVLAVVDRIFTTLTIPTDIDGQTVLPKVSIGVAIAQASTSKDTLFNQADEALYRVKNSGKNGYLLYQA